MPVQEVQEVTLVLWLDYYMLLFKVAWKNLQF
jgi:hypothetical protein